MMESESSRLGARGYSRFAGASVMVATARRRNAMAAGPRPPSPYRRQCTPAGYCWPNDSDGRGSGVPQDATLVRSIAPSAVIEWLDFDH